MKRTPVFYVCVQPEPVLYVVGTYVTPSLCGVRLGSQVTRGYFTIQEALSERDACLNTLGVGPQGSKYLLPYL